MHTYEFRDTRSTKFGSRRLTEGDVVELTDADAAILSRHFAIERIDDADDADDDLDPKALARTLLDDGSYEDRRDFVNDFVTDDDEPFLRASDDIDARLVDYIEDEAS